MEKKMIAYIYRFQSKKGHDGYSVFMPLYLYTAIVSAGLLIWIIGGICSATGIAQKRWWVLGMFMVILFGCALLANLPPVLRYLKDIREKAKALKDKGVMETYLSEFVQARTLSYVPTKRVRTRFYTQHFDDAIPLIIEKNPQITFSGQKRELNGEWISE